MSLPFLQGDFSVFTLSIVVPAISFVSEPPLYIALLSQLTVGLRYLIYVFATLSHGPRYRLSLFSSFFQHCSPSPFRITFDGPFHWRLQLMGVFSHSSRSHTGSRLFIRSPSIQGRQSPKHPSGGPHISEAKGTSIGTARTCTITMVTLCE